MNRIAALLLLVGAASCAPAAQRNPQVPEPVSLWEGAQRALAEANFSAAQTVFERLANAYPDQPAGREALFYSGAIRLDPRNPGWDPAIAAERLRAYLNTAEQGDVQRGPEAVTLLQIAEQLTLPPEQRVAGFAPRPVAPLPDSVPQVPTTPESAGLPARVDSLRREVAARDSLIQRQREELDRIRRTLTPRPPAGSNPRK